MAEETATPSILLVHEPLELPFASECILVLVFPCWCQRKAITTGNRKWNDFLQKTTNTGDSASGSSLFAEGIWRNYFATRGPWCRPIGRVREKLKGQV